jgi:hypothetical protein
MWKSHVNLINTCGLACADRGQPPVQNTRREAAEQQLFRLRRQRMRERGASRNDNANGSLKIEGSDD